MRLARLFRLPSLAATVLLTLALLTALPARSSPSPRPYVTVRDGHFCVDGQRLRLWGVNISAHHVIDHRGAEVTVARMKQLGFNCLHIWLPRGSLHVADEPYLKFRETTKGDGSPLDLFDYVVHLCHEQGLYVSLPALAVRGDNITADAFDVIPGGTEAERAAWFEAIKATGRAFPHLKFVDERLKAIYLRHAEHFLCRVNPYTGRPYAAEPTIAFWQLQDEMSFLAWPPDIGRDTWLSERLAVHWSEHLRARFADEAALVQAWGKLYPDESLAENTVRLFPIRKLAEMNPTRLADTWEFLYGLADGFYDEYLAFVRGQAAAGVGINVQPITVDSVIYNRPGLMHSALRASSFLCGTGYGAGARLLEVDGVATWVPMVKQRPPWEFHYATDGISLRADGVPCCPVAGADLTNDPFRAATPVTRALVAAWQDWDGVFTYWWGYFTDKQPLTGDGDYGRQGLRYGTPESRSTCFEVCHDEIMLSQHRAASALFRLGLIPPAPEPTVFRFGHAALFGPAATEYYHLRWPTIPATAWQHGCRVSFDPEWEGEMEPIGPAAEPPTGPLRWPSGVTWDWQEGRAVVDTPSVKAFLGEINGGFSFADGVELSGVDRDFICFALVAEDGLPLAQSRRAVLSLVSRSANTGFQFDPAKVTRNRFEMLLAHTGCVDPGTAPIIVERASARVSLPHLPGRRCRKLDFASRELAVEPASDGVTLDAREPVFYCELTVE